MSSDDENEQPGQQQVDPPKSAFQQLFASIYARYNTQVVNKGDPTICYKHVLGQCQSNTSRMQERIGKCPFIHLTKPEVERMKRIVGQHCMEYALTDDCSGWNEGLCEREHHPYAANAGLPEMKLKSKRATRAPQLENKKRNGERDPRIQAVKFILQKHNLDVKQICHNQLLKNCPSKKMKTAKRKCERVHVPRVMVSEIRDAMRNACMNYIAGRPCGKNVCPRSHSIEEEGEEEDAKQQQRRPLLSPVESDISPSKRISRGKVKPGQLQKQTLVNARHLVAMETKYGEDSIPARVAQIFASKEINPYAIPFREVCRKYLISKCKDGHTCPRMHPRFVNEIRDAMGENSEEICILWVLSGACTLRTCHKKHFSSPPTKIKSSRDPEPPLLLPSEHGQQVVLSSMSEVYDPNRKPHKAKLNVVCPLVARDGMCQFGDECQFTHTFSSETVPLSNAHEKDALLPHVKIHIVSGKVEEKGGGEYSLKTLSQTEYPMLISPPAVTSFRLPAPEKRIVGQVLAVFPGGGATFDQLRNMPDVQDWSHINPKHLLKVYSKRNSLRKLLWSSADNPGMKYVKPKFFGAYRPCEHELILITLDDRNQMISGGHFFKQQEAERVGERVERAVVKHSGHYIGYNTVVSHTWNTGTQVYVSCETDAFQNSTKKSAHHNGPLSPVEITSYPADRPPGSNPSTHEVYFREKQRQCKLSGVHSLHYFSSHTSQRNPQAHTAQVQEVVPIGGWTRKEAMDFKKKLWAAYKLTEVSKIVIIKNDGKKLSIQVNDPFPNAMAWLMANVAAYNDTSNTRTSSSSSSTANQVQEEETNENGDGEHGEDGHLLNDSFVTFQQEQEGY